MVFIIYIIGTFCLFIYLITLFNVDYKTLAAYALIKIDYPPSPPIKSIIKEEK